MKTYYAIGLMSGTSLDGLDICYLKFTKDKTWNFEILKAETLPYPKIWEEKLRNAIILKAEDLWALHSEYGFYLGEKVKKFIVDNHIKNIDLISSHGHTVFHQPNRKFTVQIGDGRAIKIVNNIPVVYDFRMQDVLLGGNGAPLVPIGDELLFSNFDACVNLGGFSNISFKLNNKRVAFDICPVNIVLNYFSKKVGRDFDEDGNLAKSGMISKDILSQLNNLNFYRQNHPKSLGTEWVQKEIMPKIERYKTEDILATFTEHIAVQIANTLNQYHLKSILFTGGGTFNTYLIEKIKSKTSSEIIIPDNEVVNFKEALIFAFLGVLKICGENNVISSATGSSADHSSGIIA